MGVTKNEFLLEFVVHPITKDIIMIGSVDSESYLPVTTNALQSNYTPSTGDLDNSYDSYFQIWSSTGNFLFISF